MKFLVKKMKEKAGESLIESMIAILIFTLSSIIMYSMVTAAGDINASAKKKDRETQEQMVIAEKGEGSGEAGTIILTIKDRDAADVVISTEEVEVYGDRQNGLFSYFAKSEEDAE